MLIVLDTNTLIRFFTNDLPEQVNKVEELLNKEKDIFIPDVVFPELEYILLKQYNSSKQEVVNAYNFLLAQNNISISNKIKTAVILYESSRLDMADCIIAAYSLKGKLASFDKSLLKVEEVTPYWE